MNTNEHFIMCQSTLAINEWPKLYQYNDINYKKCIIKIKRLKLK